MCARVNGMLNLDKSMPIFAYPIYVILSFVYYPVL